MVLPSLNPNLELTPDPEAGPITLTLNSSPMQNLQKGIETPLTEEYLESLAEVLSMLRVISGLS